MTTQAASRSESVEQIRKNGERMNVLNAKMTDAANVDILHYYTNTPFKANADTRQ